MPFVFSTIELFNSFRPGLPKSISSVKRTELPASGIMEINSNGFEAGRLGHSARGRAEARESRRIGGGFWIPTGSGRSGMFAG